MSSTSLATALVVPLEQLRMTDVEAVGGKNASLGEMISQLAASGVRVPGGFATTAHAFREFLRHGGLTERINARLATLNIDDVTALAAGRRRDPRLGHGGRRCRPTSGGGDPHRVRQAGQLATRRRRSPCARRPPPKTCPMRRSPGSRRPSSTSSASTSVLQRIKEVFASLYNDRAISYRVHKGFAHADVALSAGVQRMVRSDLGSAGVMFTHRHRVGLRRGGVHHLELRPGRDGGAGQRQPRRVLRAQADAACRQAGDHPARAGLQADPHGVRVGARRQAASWSPPSTRRPSSATAIR